MGYYRQRSLQLLLLLLHALLTATATIVHGAAHGAAHAPLFHLNNNDVISGDLDFDFELDLDDVEAQHVRDASLDRSIEVGVDALRGASMVDSASSSPLLSLDNIAPGRFQFGRGVGFATTKHVRTHEPLFAVPLQQIMSLDSAQRGRIGLLLAANPELPPAIALALHLLEEHWLGAQSNFSVLLATLPPPHAAATELNSTLFYTRAELERLEGSQLLRIVAARTAALEHYYEALREPVTSRVVDPPLFAVDEFTFAHFHWALGVVWTHAFPLHVGETQSSERLSADAERDIVLAPVLSRVALCVDRTQCRPSRIERDAATQQLVVFATQEYAPGDDVSLYIGDKSSTMLMVTYGVTHATATALDHVDISIVLDDSANDTTSDSSSKSKDPLVAVKSFLLQSYNMSMHDTYALHASASMSLSARDTASLKIKLLRGAEVARVADLFPSSESPKDSRGIVSLRNELVYTRAVVTTCTNLLAQYRTTLDADEAQLHALLAHDPTGASREAQSLRLLVLEKRILHRTRTLATQEWTDLVLSNHPNLLPGTASGDKDDDSDM